MMALLVVLAVAPTLEGAPRIRADRIGSAFGELGGRFVVKPIVTGTSEDEPAAFAFYDSRSGRTRDAEVGRFSLDFGGRFRTGRALTYDVRGWSERITDGASVLSLRVETLARNTYRVAVTLDGGPMMVTARVSGTVVNGATYDAGLLTVDNADRPAFGLALGARPGTATLAGTSGATYAASAQVSFTGSVELLLAFDETPAQARAVLAAAPASPSAVQLALTKPHVSEPRYLAAEQLALSLLRMNEVRDASGRLLGSAPAKTHYNDLWVWDSAFQSLGISEWSVPDAFAQLDSVYRGQVLGDGALEYGLLYNHVDEAGNAARLELPGYTDEYSQAPALGFAMRELYERSARDDAAKAALQRSFDAALPFVDWWFRRRDRDADGLAEYNGGWESGLDNSPRFTELWGETTARFAADDADPRPKLDCVDANAWLYVYLVELARSAELLGRSDAATFRERARALAEKIDGPDGFWDESRGLYADFVRAAGRRRFQKTVTPMVVWPLFAGLTRDEARARTVIEGQLLDPAKLWGPYGVPTVAFDDPSYESGNYWRGPVWLNTSYAAMVALFRYGYEAEAQELARRTLELTAADHGLWEYYDSKTGAGINAYQFGWTGALLLEVMRDRYQAEGFALGAKREGEIHRLVRLSDGETLVEVSVEGSFEVPVTAFSADAKLFDGAPVTMTFSDPHGVVGDAAVHVRFPAFDGVEERVVHVGETVVLSGYERRGCGCGAGPSEVTLVALLLLMWRRRRQDFSAREKRSIGG